jgi:hypothetical protein
MTGDPLKTKTRLLLFTIGLPIVLIIVFSISPALVRHIQNVFSPELAWRGRYYANTEVRGTPARVNREAVITFDWGEERPFPELPPDNFSARWTRTDKFDAGVYIFAIRSTGGVRVFLDNELIIDSWSPGYHDWTAAEREVAAGKHHLRVEYFDDGGIAYIQFGYYPAGN